MTRRQRVTCEGEHRVRHGDVEMAAVPTLVALAEREQPQANAPEVVRERTAQVAAAVMIDLVFIVVVSM